MVYNTSEMKAYAASFDKKGNLVLKFKLVNNSYGKVTNVSKFKVTVTDSSKKRLFLIIKVIMRLSWKATVIKHVQ